MGLFDLPKSTEFGRVIPKNAFDEYTNTNQKKLISDTILRITWTHKLSTETTNLKANEIKEIQFFLIELKVKSDLKNILKIIDKAIPYHVIFNLKFENEVKIITSAKHDHQTKSNESVIDCVFESYWISVSEAKIQINLKESLDALFIDFCSQLTGRINQSNNYSDFVSKEVEIKSIVSKISNIESQIKKEKQFNKKVSLNMNLDELRKELKLITTYTN